ncbi:nad-dependent epimerase dehydratase [Colletotrichum asianum]|uniref:Nad-dependent epimerase dehydratase n=1 Tax=Colletotrichum asianum TaxID=702518 RepID=A0A8H3WIR6_9PEZI|nr:nad-dependent epimerase dehydratase [Colletotrichum asianum]
MSTTKRLRVAVLGPKGQCGSCVVDELLSRGHSVVGLSRNPPREWQTSGDYKAESVDFNSINELSAALSRGYDAIVCAYGPPLGNLRAIYYECVETHARIKSALLRSNHRGSFIVIGGAGSLHHKDGSSFADEPDFPYGAWYKWSDQHLGYMISRASDHGSTTLAVFSRIFRWARNNVEHPGWFSWILRPFVHLFLSRARMFMTSHDAKGLITGSRVALHLWEGVTEKSWSFLSPPWLLRDKGIRTGKYEVYVDELDSPGYQAIYGGIYNEDMAVAIVDEVENNKLAYKHWSCVGPIGLGKW